ncbi:T9SS type A sorting domain-containing protein [Hymenobacter sp. HSC-4F20]|uniref:T9SS type A sorting domain-containing protein n=1 Tax=Hymenobacter sp. HSC-4F20 TaxID=2864135 RepID=UPI001C73855D|nr:T9SS type A sorting domain-containing protein [Hymenobacter sp. HSC-4F20]MBX0289005.1 T9SS type A sorting domain-containing protein [Hymenobacter sp. HSC-4F20]
MSVNVTATSLTAPITVTAPAGFQVSTSATGTYSQTLTINPSPSGAVNQAVFIVFAPTAAQNYVDVVTLASTGAVTRNVSVSGTGALPPATLSATPAQLDFTSTQAGQTSAPQSFNVTGNNLTAAVTVTAPTGFLIRQGTSGSFSQTVTLNPANNTVNATLQAQFAPTVAGNYNDVITVASNGNGNPSTSVRVTGTATAAPTGPFIVVNPSALDFGTVTSSGSSQTLSFTVNAGNLSAPLLLTASNSNIEFRDATAGGDFAKGTLAIAPSNGTVATRTIEVRLVQTIGSGTFTGNITASSTGATSQVVAITANNVTGNTSSINVSGTLQQFSTVPGVASAVQSYTVSGTNLLQGITIKAPTYFQVSLNSAFTGVTSTGNSIVLSRVGNDVPETTVYVRFLPPSALVNSSVILNSSEPAISQGISVEGTSQPSVAINNAFQEIRNVVINTTSGSQALTINAQRVLQSVVITKTLSENPLNPNNVPQYELSLDNVTFTNSITLTPNSSTYSINQPIYVRYKPTYLGSGQSTLQFQSNDFENKSVQNFDRNALLSGRSIDVEPTQRNTPSVVRGNTTATVTFNLPSDYTAQGYGEGRIIVASTNSTLPAGSQPADGTAYQTGNQVYGAGDQIAPGYYVVYAGANQSVVVEGLDIGTTYYFYTFEFNNINPNPAVQISGAENYLSPPVPNTIPGIIAPSPLPVTLLSFNAKVRGSQVALTWVTASELNNKGFEVERSRDGKSFETVLSRAGKGTTTVSTTYSATDEQPLSGTSIYRLKQIDFNGTVSFSSPVVVNFLRSADVNMYPNPVEDVLTIELGGAVEGAQVTITDASGRVIRSQKLDATGKLNMSDLKTGTYLVTVGEGSAKVTRHIVKK